MPRHEPLNIFIVSDATGSMAESVVTSVLVQFKQHPFKISRFPFTLTCEKVMEIIERAPKGNCVIVFSLVLPELRKLLVENGQSNGLITVDIMGPLIQIFSTLLKDSPKMKPGAFRRTDEETHRLVEAIHYTIRHDDGLGLETLDEADLIILGVSRTGKTPTSIFLSAKRLKVANIPIIKDVPLPEEIIRLPVTKVGFTIGVERLAQLRVERHRRLRGAESVEYSSLSYILEEAEYCKKTYRRIPSLAKIDVTNRSIEELSEWITREVLPKKVPG
jgi:regulator of PEP synthase PpsR (kinase-PPPase family)